MVVEVVVLVVVVVVVVFNGMVVVVVGAVVDDDDDSDVAVVIVSFVGKFSPTLPKLCSLFNSFSLIENSSTLESAHFRKQNGPTRLGIDALLNWILLFSSIRPVRKNI